MLLAPKLAKYGQCTYVCSNSNFLIRLVELDLGRCKQLVSRRVHASTGLHASLACNQSWIAERPAHEMWPIVEAKIEARWQVPRSRGCTEEVALNSCQLAERSSLQPHKGLIHLSYDALRHIRRSTMSSLPGVVFHCESYGCAQPCNLQLFIA